MHASDGRHRVQVQVKSPDGDDIPCPFTLVRGEFNTRHQGGDTLLLESGDRLDFGTLGGSFEWDRLKARGNVESHRDAFRLTLHQCLIEVWLSDAGGLDLGGVPIAVRGPFGCLRGRIGTPLLVWAGPAVLEVGDEHGFFPKRTFEIHVPTGRDTIDLGRLGCLSASWGEGRGWPIVATRLEDGWCHRGRLGDPLPLWPGRYRLHIEGGPQREIDVRPGVLTEVDMAATRRGTALSALDAFFRDALKSAVSLVKRRCVRFPSLHKSLEAIENHRTPRGGDRRAALEAEGTLQLNAVDARGYLLTGRPYRLRPSKGTESLDGFEGRIGVPLPVSPGQYHVELLGIPGIAGRVVVDGGSELSSLKTPGALRLVYRDGLGRSLRGMVYTISGEFGVVRGALSRERLLLPGRYRVKLDVFPVVQKEVDVRSGEVLHIDLGAMGRYHPKPTADAPWGTPVMARPVDESGNAVGPERVVGRVGVPIDLPAGSYLFRIGEVRRRVDLRIGRMRKPTVVGRGFEPLANDDANRETASPAGTPG